MEKIVIKKVSRFTKNKDGDELVSSTGRPYTRVVVEDTQGRKMSGFGNASNESWKEGDEVEVEIEQKGEYLNFKTPKAGGNGISPEQYQILMREVQAIKVNVLAILAAVKKEEKNDDFRLEEPPF